MAYVAPQPPAANGLCPLIDDSTICMAVQNSLASIRSSFQQTEFQSVVDTFYITSTYNSTVAGTKIDTTNVYPIINGDTCEHCLSMYDQANMPSGM